VLCQPTYQNSNDIISTANIFQALKRFDGQNAYLGSSLPCLRGKVLPFPAQPLFPAPFYRAAPEATAIILKTRIIDWS
jgi:hypothetical protein